MTESLIMYKRVLSFVILLLLLFQASGQVVRFGDQSIELDGIELVTFNTAEEIINISLSDGSTHGFNYYDNCEFSIGLPVIEIMTGNNIKEVESKVDYEKGVFTLSGFGKYNDVEETAVEIRGRGNSSWGYHKKPYRLKFKDKIKLCGLKTAKNYILLASWTDQSFAQFALAIRVADMLGLEYTPHVVPVEVVLDGEYKGLYLLTNKPGLNSGSVDLGDDEPVSVMWELDSYFDEDYKFMSPLYDLPVNLSDPDIEDMDEGYSFGKWQDDFMEMEENVMLGNAAEYIDMDVAAKYFLVNDIIRNNEMAHPKSIKLYKTDGGKYTFGPIWDFDWAMGGPGWGVLDNTYNPATAEDLAGRHKFINDIEKDETYKAYRKKYWKEIRDKVDELCDYIDDFTLELKAEAYRNREKWPVFCEHELLIPKMKEWLKIRYAWLYKNIPVD